MAQQGSEITAKDFPGGLPEYKQWLAKAGEGKMLPHEVRTRDLRNISPFSVPIDLAGQAVNTLQGEDFNTLQGNLSPSIRSYVEGVTGNDIENGRNLSTKERLGSQIFQSAPGATFLHPRESKTFGKDDRRQTLMRLLFGDVIQSRKTNANALARQARGK